jgi:hypothetical protein
MSISQLIAQTLMIFKVDASQAKAEIKALQGAEKAAAEETVRGIEKRNAAYESAAKMITKVNAVLAVSNEVLKVGGEAFKAYEENSRLSIAAANVSIGALRSSSQGLRTDLDLLKLAAAGNAATFKSTQAQLENAAAAMVAFERAGFDAAQSTEKVRDAIMSGNIGPLKALGINLDMAKTKQEQFSQLQTVLSAKAREAGAAHAGAGEEFKRAAVEYDNAMREIKIAIGELVVALAPLLSALAKAVGLIADVARGAGSMSLAGGMEGKIRELYGKYNGDYFASDPVRAAMSRQEMQKNGPAWESSFSDPRAQAKIAAFMESMAAIGGQLSGSIKKPGTGGGSGYRFGGVGGYGSEARGDYAGSPIGFSTDFGGGEFGGGLAVDPTTAARRSRYAGASSQRTGFEGSADALSKLSADLQSAGQQSILAKAFGPISEFDAYATAFSTLTGAAQAGFTAWIDGSMSAGAAIKKHFGESLKSIAAEMFGKAIQHGAYALGSLAFGDMKGAATHGLAAAKFGAGALAVGALAKGLGGGASAGASASGGGGGGAPSVIGAGGGSPVRSNAPINVYVGDVFADDNPRQRAGRVQRAVRMAQREASGSVTWDN